MKIEILSSISDGTSNPQLNLLLFLSDSYCRKLRLTDSPGHDEKVMPDKKMIYISRQDYNGGNRVY